MKRSALHLSILAGMAALHTTPGASTVAGRESPPRLAVFAEGDTSGVAIAPRMELRPLGADGSEYELLIYGDIGDSWWGESVTAKSVVDQLNALEDAVTTINVRVNSFGGSVADGLAIHNALRRHKAKKVVTVDGVAMSSASLIAMAGDTVQMYAASMLMIHAPWTYAGGNAEELRQVAKVLDTYAEAMSGAYTRKSGKDKADVLSLLTDGQDHYYTGEQAKDEGFCDALLDSEEEAGEDTEEAAAILRGVDRFTASASKAVAARVAAAVRNADRLAAQPASAPATPPAPTQESDMFPRAHLRHRPQNTAGSGGGGGGAAPAAPAAPPAAAAPSNNAAILASDQERRTAIRALFQPHAARSDAAALATLQQQCEDDHGCTVEAAGLKLLAQLGAGAAPLAANPRIELGNDLGAQAYREGAVTAVLHRFNPAAHKLDEKSHQFRGMTLLDMARDACMRAGTNTRGMSRHEIAVKALHSTSDFPIILGDTVNRTLRAGYANAARTFVPFCRQTTLPDFKEVSRVQLAGAPNLKRVLEGAQYQYGTIGEGAEKIRVLKYGRLIAISWETIINDDLDALTRIPMSFGASSADLESDLVYGIFTGNPAMADGVALFHGNHGNLGTATALDGSGAGLAEMRKKMLLQKGIEGRYITVRPKFLVVPPSLEEVALKATSAVAFAGKSVDINVVGPSLSPIVEPRLEDASATAWFGAADPSTVDTIEYAYLEGHEGVFTETRGGFDRDGVEIKCRHVVGAKAIDHRGLFKNEGA